MNLLHNKVACDRGCRVVAILLAFFAVACAHCDAATSSYGLYDGERLYVITFAETKRAAADEGTYRIYFPAHNTKNNATVGTLVYPFAATTAGTGIKLTFRRGPQACLPWLGKFSRGGRLVSFTTTYATGEIAHLRFESISDAAVAGNLPALQNEAALLGTNTEPPPTYAVDVYVPHCR